MKIRKFALNAGLKGGLFFICSKISLTFKNRNAKYMLLIGCFSSFYQGALLHLTPFCVLFALMQKEPKKSSQAQTR
ncbi:MAG TPA: hypothetical protein VK927_04590 [Adhaeribacter sp.]|nr:hypothetical protein [Adhaeribacter sp.]